MTLTVPGGTGKTRLSLQLAADLLLLPQRRFACAHDLILLGTTITSCWQSKTDRAYDRSLHIRQMF
ncbi:MAG: hypothetical protein KDI79_25115 [Anaerolineae bacterium]|nr:hypothetical protein [Anaerolineae bacterium]